MDESGSSPSRLPSFAERLNYLWDTRLSPRGTPYTLREVHEATGRKLSMSYLSLLRKGGVAAPSGDKMQVLANFFGVPVSYFTADRVPEELAASDIDDELRDALRNPMVRELALRAKTMGREEWELVLHMMQHAREIVDKMRLEPRTSEQQADTDATEGRSKD